MNKVSGLQSDFHYFLNEEGSTRYVLGYGLKQIEGSELYEWYEVYLPKKQTNMLSFQIVKDAILADINARTDEKILSGFVWENINVWLSAENQRNFSEAQRMANALPDILPLTFKLGENENEEPVYHTFETAEELNGFYVSAFAFINQCLNEGWQEKDSIDWTPYEEFFPEPSDKPIEEET